MSPCICVSVCACLDWSPYLYRSSTTNAFRNLLTAYHMSMHVGIMPKMHKYTDHKQQPQAANTVVLYAVLSTMGCTLTGESCHHATVLSSRLNLCWYAVHAHKLHLLFTLLLQRSHTRSDLLTGRRVWCLGLWCSRLRCQSRIYGRYQQGLWLHITSRCWGNYPVLAVLLWQQVGFPSDRWLAVSTTRLNQMLFTSLVSQALSAFLPANY